MISRHNFMVGTTAIALALAAHDSAFAQATEAQVSGATTPAIGLSDVTVTAERRSTTAQKAPLSVTVISAAKLESTAVSTYRDALKDVPSVIVQGTTNVDNPDPVIAIRGLGTDGGSRTEATAVYVDGIIVNNAGLQFYDLNRIEVLSGPQATLYGGVATAGAVNIVTNNPSFAGTAGSAAFGIGNYSAISIQGMANIPFSNVLAARVAVSESQRGNFYGQDGSGRTEVNGRLKLLYQPTGDLSVLLGGEIYHFTGTLTDGLAEQSATGSFSKPIPAIGYGYINDDKVYATVSDNLGWANVTFIPSLQTSDTDLTGEGVPYSGGYTTGRNNTPYQDQVDQELRLSSATSAAVKWVAGMYFQHAWWDKTNYSTGNGPEYGGGQLPVTNNTPVIFAQTIDYTQYHPFAQATVPVTSGIRFTGGVSYTSYEIYYPQTQKLPSGPPTFTQTVNYQFDQTYHKLDGVARIEADLNPTSLVYASFSTGFRPGGPGGGAPSSYYKMETVKAFEIGSKNRFLENTLQLNGDIYYDDFPSMQSQTNAIVAGVPIQTDVSLPATLYGAEVSAIYRVTPADTISANAAWEKARFGADYTAGYSEGPNFVNVVVPTNGAQLTHAPEWNLSADYSHVFVFDDNSTLKLEAGVNYKSSQIVSFDPCAYSTDACAQEGNPFTGFVFKPQYSQAAYTLVDGSLTYTLPNPKYSVTVYGRNLTNVVYETNSTFGLANLGDPRTFGAVIQAKF